MDAPPLEVLLMPESLRILVVLPMYGGSLPIGRYCATALRQLGHSVRVFDAPKLYAGYQGFTSLDLSPARQTPIENSFLRLVAQAACAQAEEQQAQMVLALAQAPLDRASLMKMRQNGMKTIMWFVEDYRLFTYWQAFAPLYDAFAVIQKEPFLSELAKIGQNHAFYLPLAALPDFHKPIELTDAERRLYGSDISFLGAGYPNRRAAFRPLAGKNFKIWGSDWDGETILAPNIQRGGARIGEDEAVKIYNAAKINLNLHSSIHADKLVSNGDFVNPRTYELAAMGAFQLVDQRQLMAEQFGPDEMATFAAPEEFYAKIDYFLAHPEERKAYASRARKRALAEHTYARRMETLIAYMRENFGPFAVSETPPDVPPELAAAIQSLTDRLGLAPNAPFDDVVGRLRRQSGELDGVETAILFLDEWRKQYLR